MSTELQIRARQDDEANRFACALLMPKEMFLKAVEEVKLTTRDPDKRLIALGKIFQVPLAAVVLRFQMLELK